MVSAAFRRLLHQASRLPDQSLLACENAVNSGVGFIQDHEKNIQCQYGDQK